MHADEGEVVQQFGVGVETQREAAGDIGFGLFQLGFGRAFGDEFFHHGAGVGKGGSGVFLLSGEADAERPCLGGRFEGAEHAVGVAVAVAQFFHQPAVEAAAAEDVVTCDQCVVVGVVPLDERHTEQDLRLFAGKRDVAPLRGVVADVRRAAARAAFGRQSFERVFGQFFGAAAADVADDGDDGVVFTVAGAVEGADVVEGNVADGVDGDVGAAAVGMVGVVEFGQGAACDEAGVGFFLLQSGDALFLQAGEGGGIKSRPGQRGVEEGGGLLEDRGLAQAAHFDGRGLQIAGGGEVGGNVVGAGVERFFIELFGARSQQCGGEFGYFAFVLRVERAACAFEADCHVDYRVFVVFHQQNLRAFFGFPALDVDGGLCGQGQDGEGEDEGFQLHVSVAFV